MRRRGGIETGRTKMRRQPGALHIESEFLGGADIPSTASWNVATSLPTSRNGTGARQW